MTAFVGLFNLTDTEVRLPPSETGWTTHRSGSLEVHMLAGTGASLSALSRNKNLFLAANPLADKDRLQAAFVNGSAATALAETRGHFCGFYHSAETSTLQLFTDRVGMLPMFVYAQGNGLWLFGSSLTLLCNAVRALSLPLRPSGRGIGIQLQWKTTLADETAAEQIRSLPGGHILTLASSGSQEMGYNPAAKPMLSDSADVLAEEAARLLHDAIMRRADHQGRTERAFLSGGLDSRLIAARLASDGRHVRSYCFSRANSLDTLLSQALADHCGIEHTHKLIGSFNLKGGLPFLLRAQLQAEGLPASDWCEAWSGVGGSGVLGFVGWDETAAQLLENGEISLAASHMCERLGQSLPGPILGSLSEFGIGFVGEARQRFEEALAQSLTLAVQNNPYNPLYTFMIEAHQRPHEYRFMDKAHEHRIVQLFPFLDPVFLDFMARVPPHLCVKHRFYHLVMEKLVPKALDIAWQAYPRQTPCPHPMPDGAELQWGREITEEEREARHQQSVAALRALIRHPAEFGPANPPIAGMVLAANALNDRLLSFRAAKLRELHMLCLPLIASA